MATATLDTSKMAGCYGALTLTVDLPALTGSDKQIAWANDLRTKALVGALSKLVESPAAAQRINADPRKDALLAALAAEAISHAEAQWWIDNRGGLVLLQGAAKRVMGA